MRPFQSVNFTSPNAGPKLIVLGAVHGNEVAGTHAIERAIADFENGNFKLVAGSVTFVPVTNPLAYERAQRMGDRNLNRNLSPTETPQEFEDHIANWLCPLLAQHDVLLDLHTFQSHGQAFAMIGPHDNAESLEPFAQSANEESLAVRLGVNRIVDGWLATYATGVARRIARFSAIANRTEQLNADPKYGVGTTEYMRAHGGYAITLECGQHDDPLAPQVAWQAISNALAHLGIISAHPPVRMEKIEALSLFDVIDRLHAEDSFSRTWSSFDPISRGDLIGTRANGDQLFAEHDGYIVFPNTRAQVGQEWFYLARPNPRFDKVI